MSDPFTSRVKKVLYLARDEAGRLQHDYIGTEHYLLGILGEGEGIAAKALQNLGLSYAQVQQVIVWMVPPSDGTLTIGEIPFTPRAKRVLELSVEEARLLGHDYVGAEHLLLGLIRESDGTAARVLHELGAAERNVREEVLRLITEIGPEPREPLPEERPSGPKPDEFKVGTPAGSTLRARLEASGLAVEEVLEIGRKIAKELERVHGCGWMQLDLKPETILLTPEGEVQLLGFGLWKALRPKTDPAASKSQEPVVGTPAYMAPEQLRGDDVDSRCDLYSFGVVLYEMATGTRPFTAASPIELFSKVLLEEPEPPRRLRAELPTGLDSAIMKCLEKEPGGRYQSARELLIDLEV